MVEDANRAQDGTVYEFAYVDQAAFATYAPKKFADVLANFRKYKDDSYAVGENA